MIVVTPDILLDAIQVTQDGYEKEVRQAAEEGAGQNCASRRWELGWASYLSAAVAHDNELGGTR